MYTGTMKRKFRSFAILVGYVLTLMLASCVIPAKVAVTSIKPGAISAPLPPPSKPPVINLAVYRTDTPDGRVRALSQTMAVGFQKSPDPEKALGDFAIQLVKGESDPYMKVKLIHDWIALSISYDVPMLERQTVTGQDIRTVLASRKAVCSGYSRLFETMASAVGMTAKTIHGWARGLSGNFEFNLRNSHAWNMVNIGGRWLFVDTTFDAGAFTDGQYKQRYSTDYLFADPAQLQYTHFPENPADQLVSKPIDRNRFINQALFLPEFFKYGLSIPAISANPEHYMPALVKSTERFSLDIEAPVDVILDAALLYPDGKEVAQAVMLSQPSLGTWRISFAFPKAGTYKAMIFAGKKSTAQAAGSPAPGGDKELLKGAISFGFQTHGDRVEFPAFPKQYAGFFDRPGEFLESPMVGVLKAGVPAKFVYLSNAKQVSLIHDGNFLPLIKNLTSAGKFELELKVPKTELLKLGVSEDGVNFSIVLSWQVR